MYRLYSQGKGKHYGISHYVVDTVEDILKLPPYNMGNTAYVITTSELYMLGSDHTWYPIKITCGGSGDNEGETPEGILGILGLGILGQMILGKEE